MQTVLVIDDELDLASNLSELLRGLGYNTRVANSVRQAHEVLREECIDVILSDIMMPKLRGTLLGPLIYADSRFSHIPIVFMTGYDFEQEKIAEQVLQKPFNTDDLCNALQTAMNKDQ